MSAGFSFARWLLPLREKGLRLAQQMQVGPCMPVGTQLQTAAVGPTSVPTGRLSHFDHVPHRPVAAVAARHHAQAAVVDVSTR